MKEKAPKKPSIILKNFHIENTGKAVRVRSNVVENKKLTTSSRQWLRRHINDEFTQKSKAFGYRARSAFKLIEIQEKFEIIKPYSAVLDLGCAPGSWSEVVVKFTKNKVIGIDLLETQPLTGVFFLQGDFLDENIQNQALELNNGKKFDVIVSDISPNTTGMQTVDHLRIMFVLEIETAFVLKNLKANGSFVAKVFQGEGLEEQIKKLKQVFVEVKIFKPKASRKESKEIYLVCRNFLLNI
jgi:23S rRNA (uridine2552-2'-O)-methyltransferase